MAVRTPPTDEDTWVVPSIWSSKTDPFRGRPPARKVMVNTAAAQAISKVLTRSAEQIRVILGHRDSHRMLAQRGARYIAESGVDPLGAAVCAAIGMDTKLFHPRALSRYYDDHADLADYLVATHGFGFAVATVAALTGVYAENRSPNAWDTQGKPDHYAVLARHCDPPATLVRRMRTLLASADDMDYADALEQARQCRRGTLSIRLLTSYLFPTEQHWVTTDLADPDLSDSFGAIFLLASVTEPAHAHRIIDLLGWHWHVLRDNKSLTYSLAAHLGPDAAAVLIRLWERGRGNSSAPGLDAVSRLLAYLPSDTAMDFLAEHAWRNSTAAALLAATKRFPARAMRVLAARTTRNESIDDFRQHVRRHPELAAASREELPASARQLVVESLPGVTVATTPAEAVPAILRNPPWHRPRPKATPAVTLEAPTAVRVSWRDGEREHWLDRRTPLTESEVHRRLNEAASDPSSVGDWLLQALAQADLALAEPHLRTEYTDWFLWSIDGLMAVAAAHDAAANDLVLGAVAEDPRELAAAIAPFESQAAAALVVDWLRLRSRRRIALDWLRRHPAYAATAFIPGAISKARKARRTHSAALRTLATLGHADAIMAAADAYGATAAVRELLDTAPAEIVPARTPVLPKWLSILELPPIVLTSGHPLPAGEVATLVTFMMLSEPGEPHGALARIREHCDKSTLATATGAIFEQWTNAGARWKDNWVWEALAAFGNDDTVAKLLPKITWDTGKDNALDVLAAIGSDYALSALIKMSEQGRNATVRSAAQLRVAELAEDMGLTEDQLADRMVPDLGLRPDGTALLDFGPRLFVVGFDEQLGPTLTGVDGTHYRSLPKAGTRDDPAMAAEATARYRAIRKSVKKFAAEQISRLERAMVAERRITLDELRTLFIAHPLRITLTRRLVWANYRDGQVVDSFRIAEDNSFVDVADNTVDLAEDLGVGIAHPLHLGAEVTAAWAGVLADHQLRQPFPQIDREVVHGEPHLLTSSSVPIPDQATVSLRRIYGLTHRGWNPPERGAGGCIDTFEKRLPEDRLFVIGIDPGMEPFEPVAPVHELTRATLIGGTFGDLSPVTRSEILRDIAWLCAPL